MKNPEHPDESRAKAWAAVERRIENGFEWLSLDLSKHIGDHDWIAENLSMSKLMVQSDPEYAEWLFNSLEVIWRSREQKSGPTDDLISDVVNHPLAPQEVKVEFLDALAGRWRGRVRDNVRSVVQAGAYGMGKRR